MAEVSLEYTFESSFRIPFLSWKMFGLPLNKSEMSLTTLFCLEMICATFAIVGEILYIHYSPVDDENRFLDMACIVMCLLSILKGIVSAMKRFSIVKQVDSLREMYTEEMENSREIELVNRVLSFSVLISKLVFILNIALGLVFNYWVVLSMTYTYIFNKDEFKYLLPFYVYLPYELDSWIGWIVPMVSLNLGSYCTIFGIVTADTHFYIAVGHICAHLKVVAHRLRTLQVEREQTKPSRHMTELQMHTARKPIGKRVVRDTPQKTEEKSNSEKTRNEDTNYRLANVIKRHQTIFEIANDLEDIFAPNFLFNFMVSSIMICLLGFIITGSGNANKPQCMLFLVTILTQILILCMFGNMLIEASSDIRGAMWESKWYAADKRVAHDLLFIHKRAAKPICVTAYKFSTIEYTSFARILSTSWSYFTLLSTMYK